MTDELTAPHAEDTVIIPIIHPKLWGALEMLVLEIEGVVVIFIAHPLEQSIWWENKAIGCYLLALPGHAVTGG